MRHDGKMRRPGFTLIEALVVIGIITVLVALTATGTMKLMAEQVRKTTEATIQKVASAVNNQWRETTRDAVDDSIDRFPAVLQMANNDPRMARVLYLKLRLQHEFPTTFMEINQPPAGLPVKALYSAAISSANYNRDQGAACLFLCLQAARRGGGPDPDSFLNSNEALDRHGDGLKEIVDGWGNGLRLFRWPTGAEAQDWGGPGGPVAGNQDPCDPDGLLALIPQFSLHPKPPQGMSYRLEPVIASAGPNGRWGVDENLNVTNAIDANDNIYSFRLRQTGAGGEF